MPEPQRIPAHKLRPGDVIVMGGEHEGATAWSEVVTLIEGPDRFGDLDVWTDQRRVMPLASTDRTFTVIERGPE